MKLYEKITEEMRSKCVRFHSNDNISEFVEGHLDDLIDEASQECEKFLRALLIDVEEDPNAIDTARRIAKMYYKEIMSGRYDRDPKITSFPNESGYSYDGMIVVRAEIKSICSHHHKDVTGVAYIGVVPGEEVIGLSKYIRIAQHCARRGTLQEQLTTDIANAIAKACKTDNVAVYIIAKHGCVSCRGVGQSNSNTQTAVLYGGFKTDPTLRNEFYSNVNIQTQLEAGK